jgi:predicted Zn-dependent protease
MLDTIIQALRSRSDLHGWTVRHVATNGAQLYAVPGAVEASRNVQIEHFVVDLLRHTPGPQGAMSAGSGTITILPGDDVGPALDTAALMAGLVHNPPYSLPRPASMPDVPVADPLQQRDAEATLARLHERLRAAVAADDRVSLAAAEFFADERSTRLLNSIEVDASQVETTLYLELALIARAGEREAEAFGEVTRRRVDDLDIEEEVRRHAQFATDSLAAGGPTAYTGPVVLRGPLLATFLNGGTLHYLSSAAAKYAKLSEWEIGQPIFRSAVEGDPLTIFANRQLAYGTHADRFDDEGLPAQRVPLIRDNVLQTFIANQRYADYLRLPPTGDFGDIELPAGATPVAELLAEPYVEIAAFSWFHPDAVTGAFASEIRLGYLCEDGKRTPFKGGALVGNVLDALANVRWSRETAFYGDYLGPTTARFGQLTVSGTGVS